MLENPGKFWKNHGKIREFDSGNPVGTLMGAPWNNIDYTLRKNYGKNVHSEKIRILHHKFYAYGSERYDSEECVHL